METDINIETQNMGQNMPAQSPEKSHPSLYVLVFVLMVIAVLAYIFYKKEETSKAKRPTISGFEVAVKTTTFLDKVFNGDGSVLGGYTCAGNFPGPDTCVPLPLSDSQPHVGQAIFSYFLLSEASGQFAYREKADQVMDWVLNQCDTDVRMCEWNFFPLSHYYEKTREQKYLTRGMLRPAEKFLTMSSKEVIDGNVGHKLASLYKVTEDERFKKRLLEVADEQLAARQSPGYFYQLAWSIYTPAYKITNDKKYLTAMENFFDNFNPTDIKEFDSLVTTGSAVKAAESLLGLAEISDKNTVYKEKAHATLQRILDELWDTPQNPKFTGDYGFVDVKPKLQDYKVHKPTILNGWLVKLFVLMRDERFEMP